MASSLLLNPDMKSSNIKSWIVTFTLVLFSASSHSQTEDLDYKGPQLKEGRMFTLKLIPAGRKLEIQVIGKDVAAVDLNEIALFATARSGTESWDVQVEREGSRFLLAHPTSKKDVPKHELKVKVVRKRQAEEFHFPSVPAPR